MDLIQSRFKYISENIKYVIPFQAIVLEKLKSNELQITPFFTPYSGFTVV